MNLLDLIPARKPRTKKEMIEYLSEQPPPIRAVASANGLKATLSVG